jgi:hypothetical protein
MDARRSLEFLDYPIGFEQTRFGIAGMAGPEEPDMEKV